jgi:hypothetical protein
LSGLGNLKENSIPICQAKRLQAFANELYEPSKWPVPFWLDTLCVPLQRPARDRAIALMCMTYKCAQKVLVLDSVLSQVPVSTTNATELAMRIRVSTWGRRLWTFHEACLAQNLYYQFQDQAICLQQLKDMAREEQYKFETNLCHNTETISSPHSGNKMLEDFEIIFRCQQVSNMVLPRGLRWIETQENAHQVPASRSIWRMSDLTNCLRYRWTSRLEDETICLSGIFDHGLDRILKYESREERMREFLWSFQSIPADLLFINRPRLCFENCRWMPSTFLGGDISSSALTLPGRAIPTEQGLKLSTEGIAIHDLGFQKQLASMPSLLYNNHLYKLESHSATTLKISAKSAIILRYRLLSTESPAPGMVCGKADGVLVTIREWKQNVLVVRFQQLISLIEVRQNTGARIAADLRGEPLGVSQEWLVT